SHPFPFMSNQSINFGIVLRDPVSMASTMVRIKIPRVLAAWVPLGGDGRKEPRVFALQSYVIRACAGRLFPGLEIVDVTPFRIIRNALVELERCDSEGMPEAVSEAVRQRRFEPVVRVDFRKGDNNPDLRKAL